MRSPVRAPESSAFSRVVLPLWVAPETRIFCPESTQTRRNSAACWLSDPRATSRCRSRMRLVNLRMLTAQCRCVTSGITTCSLDPSGSEASTKGDERSTRRPVDCSIRSTRSRTSVSVSSTVVSSGTPLRAMKTFEGPLIQISSMSGSSKNGWSTPNPVIEATISRAAWCSSTSIGREPPRARSL